MGFPPFITATVGAKLLRLAAGVFERFSALLTAQRVIRYSLLSRRQALSATVAFHSIDGKRDRFGDSGILAAL